MSDDFDERFIKEMSKVKPKAAQAKIRGIKIDDELWDDIMREGEQRGIDMISTTARVLIVERLNQLKQARSEINGSKTV
jgi:hypothetical protein